MARSRAIIVKDGAVALIERRRAGKLYYAFPGGGVEDGESPVEAAAREVREELGLIVSIRQQVARGIFAAAGMGKQVDQHYFLAEIIGGTFGSGDGLEVPGGKPPERGAYTPVWMPLAELPGKPVYPQYVAELIVSAAIMGWPETVVQFQDIGTS